MRTYAKAIVGAVAAGLAALGTALIADGVSPVEWVGVATAVVVTAGVVFETPNQTA